VARRRIADRHRRRLTRCRDALPRRKRRTKLGYRCAAVGFLSFRTAQEKQA
jgi:hypothetical protein